MKFSTFFTALVTTAVLSQAVPQQRSAYEAFIPHILEPNSKTVWKIGEYVKVTWDISDIPEHITNDAAIELRNRHNHDLSIILAKSFDFHVGYIIVRIPDSGEVCSGNDWEIILYGDSDNVSDDFIIWESDKDAKPPPPPPTATATRTSNPASTHSVCPFEKRSQVKDAPCLLLKPSQQQESSHQHGSSHQQGHNQPDKQPHPDQGPNQHPDKQQPRPDHDGKPTPW